MNDFKGREYYVVRMEEERKLAGRGGVADGSGASHESAVPASAAAGAGASMVKLLGRGSWGISWQGGDIADEWIFTDVPISPVGEVAAGLARLIALTGDIDGVLPLECVLAGETSVRLVYPDAGGSLLGQVTGGIAADPGRMLRCMASLASGLAKLHAAGVVHGDLTPENVLLTGDRALLLHAGVATVICAIAPGAFIPTDIDFRAPEIARSGVSSEGDIYAFGALLSWLAANMQPSRGDGTGSPDPPPCDRSATPSSGAALGEVIGACLARDPAKRPSAGALAIALAEAADAESPERALGNAARRPLNRGPAKRTTLPNRPRNIGAAVVFALGLIAGAAIMALGSAPQHPHGAGRPLRQGAHLTLAPGAHGQ